MTSELQRVAQKLVEVFDQAPGIIAALQGMAAKEREHAALVVVDPSSSLLRDAALQLDSAARDCEDAADKLALAAFHGRGWAQDMVDGISPHNPPEDRPSWWPGPRPTQPEQPPPDAGSASEEHTEPPPSSDSGSGSATATPGSGVTIDRLSINVKISHQKHQRHVKGSGYRHGGYFNDAADAQRVLDEFHHGLAEVLGTNGNNIVIRSPNVTGINHNPRSGYFHQKTDVFLIKGSVSPSIVPTNPGWMP